MSAKHLGPRREFTTIFDGQLAEKIEPRNPITIKIPDMPLGWKLECIAATLDAVREAHRDQISAVAWEAINCARAQIAIAMMAEARTAANRPHALPAGASIAIELPKPE